MEINTLGSVLKYYREKYEIMQDDLCCGICTPVILSQIENGKKVVDSLLAEALLGRIGKTVLQFELLLNEEDHYLWNLREEILRAEQMEDYGKIRVLLEEYNARMPQKSVHMQFYLLHSARCKIFDTASNEEICNMLYEALMMTKPNYDKADAKGLLYNATEIEIIILLYHHKFSKWNDKDFENELSNLLMFVKKIYSGRLKQDVGTQILLELIAYEQSIDDYVCTIKYVDEAIAFLSQGRTLDNIAELHFIKAQMIEKLYNQSEQWNMEKSSCKQECLMAYYVFDIMEQEDKRNEVQIFCEEKLGWQITK